MIAIYNLRQTQNNGWVQLGADFPIKLEAPHVVNMRKQVLVNVIACGPSGRGIQATYKGSNEPTFPVSNTKSSYLIS